MLNGVSNVAFSAGVFDRPNITAPQTYVRPGGGADAVDLSGKKKGKGKKVLAFLLTTAAVVAGLIVGHNKGAFKNVGKIIPEGVKNAKWLQWLKKPTKVVMNALDTAGGWLKSVPEKVAAVFGKNSSSKGIVIADPIPGNCKL